ncbi:IS3 family transposase [Alkalicoccobacillus plakortidis]|uniref:IS3 family transposase n=1 Tax=Alkalicoccobacillus plakortidis TaxID=444060 RepID=UPI00358DCEBB
MYSLNYEKKIRHCYTNNAHHISLDQLILKLDDYINWYNMIRSHGTLGYKASLD